MVNEYEDKFGELLWRIVQYYTNKAVEDDMFKSPYREFLKMSDKHEEILKSRAPVYGEAKINLACTQELCETFDRYFNRNGSVKCTAEEFSAQKAAIHLALTKIARIATGSFHEDNYYDGSNYIEIARKIMMGESTLPSENISGFKVKE